MTPMRIVAIEYRPTTPALRFASGGAVDDTNNDAELSTDPPHMTSVTDSVVQKVHNESFHWRNIRIGHIVKIVQKFVTQRNAVPMSSCRFGA